MNTMSMEQLPDIIERLDDRRSQESGITELEILLLDAADEIETIRARQRIMDMHSVTESIYSGKSVIVPLADVQHIETGNSLGLVVVTKHTRWDNEAGGWANSIWIDGAEAVAFKRAWCTYRAELETESLMDLSPNEIVRDNSQFGVGS